MCCGWDYEARWQGKQVAEWADPDVLAEFDCCWAGLAARQMAEALRASMDLFTPLAGRSATALSLGLFHHQRIRQEVERMLRGSDATSTS